MDCVCRVLVVDDISLVLWLHTKRDSIDAAEWDEAMTRVRNHIGERDVPVSRLRGLVVSDGGAPNTAQRAELNESLWRGQTGKHVVITTVLENPIKRGIATALTWLNPGFRFYRPSGFDEALQYLNLSQHRVAIWAKYAPMQLLLPHVKALDMIADASGLPRHPAVAEASSG